MSQAFIISPGKQAPNRGVRLARWVMGIHFLDDLVALILSYKIAFALRFPEATQTLFQGGRIFSSTYADVYYRKVPVYLLLCAAVLLFCYALLGMYDGHRRIRRTPLLWNALVGNGVVIGIVAVYLFFSKSTWHMRGFIPLVLLINIPLTVAVRMVTNGLLTWARQRHPSLRVKALLIGYNADAQIIAGWAAQRRMKGCDIVRHIASPETVEQGRRRLPKLLDEGIDVVYLMDRAMDTDRVMDVVRICARQNKMVKVLFPRFLELHNPFGYGDEIEGVPIVHFDSPCFSSADAWYRRIASRLAAAVLMPPFVLLHVVLAALIRLDSPGPVLFVQNRVGRGGRIFRMYKYRTMCLDAEERIETLRAMNETDGALFKMRDDPRVTRFGRLLRRSSLDEIPQLINIFRREMRFVGPRPLPARDLCAYEQTWYYMRQSCPPGITCLWQVAGRSHVGFEDMCLLDIWYALNRNWMLDTWIVLRTIWVVAFGRGAY